ncbi:MAG: phage/plasmid primase, P4 family [Eubacteriales bacterium]
MTDGCIYTTGKIPNPGERLTDPTFTPHKVSPKHGDYANVFNGDFIKLDLDSEEEFEKAIAIVDYLNVKCNILKTTSGGHIYFKNCGLKSNKGNWYAFCGLFGEWKLATSNETVPMRRNGIDLLWLRGSAYNSDIDVMPIPLRPMCKSQPEDFKSMGDGDGRNQAFFNYILKLSGKMSKEEIRTTIRIINKFIIIDPLRDLEIETILRDEAFPSAMSEGKFNHAVFGDELISELNLISVNGSFYTYSSGNYAPKENDEINAIIINSTPDLKINQRREIIEFMKGRCAKIVKPNTLKRINVINGILEFIPNKETKDFDIKLLEHSPQIIDFKQFNAEYNPAIEYPLLDETMIKVFCGDKELVNLFDEIIGYLMMDHVNFHKCFFFSGKPSGGKSNILKMIINFIGKQHVSTLSLKDFNDKFRLSSIVNKTANISADLDQTTISESGNFKSLVTGDGVTVEEKYGKSYTYYNTSKLLFGCNALPHFVDKGGVMRRPVIIPFNHKFSKSDDDFNPFIDDDLATPECMSYLLRRGIEGYKRLYMNGGFTEPMAVQKELQKFKINNSNVLTWMNECEIDSAQLEREFIKDLYRMFGEWCVRNNCNSPSRRSFTDELVNEYDLVVKPKRIPSSKERDSMFVKRQPDS